MVLPSMPYDDGADGEEFQRVVAPLLDLVVGHLEHLLRVRSSRLWEE